MEQEFKWNTNEQIPALLQALPTNGAPEVLTMSAVYYDTADRLLSHQKTGLRIRQENDQSVCCLKITEKNKDGLSLRYEYEVSAADILEGLEKLPAVGAPVSLCRQLLQSGVIPICRTDFVRKAYICTFPEFSMELALDQGYFNETVPFSELEAEQKSGEFAAFYDFCQNLQDQYSLIPQPLSKLARAMAPQAK